MIKISRSVASATGLVATLVAAGLIAGSAATASSATVITGSQIKDGTISQNDIGAGGVSGHGRTAESEIMTGSINQSDIRVGGVSGSKGAGEDEIQKGSIGADDLAKEVTDKLGGPGPQGPAGPAGPAGPPGPAGPAGDSDILSAVATTSVTDRNDSGHHGDWAKDSFTRTVSVTRQHASTAAKCGGGATQCWFYTASLADSGTFTTIDGANSPQDGTAIAGTVMGTFNGGSRIEFYANSDSPNPSIVPATVTGNALATSDWVKEFFAADTVFSSVNLLNWAWTYTAPNTCEQWINAVAGDSGDITGVNACAPSS